MGKEAWAFDLLGLSATHMSSLHFSFLSIKQTVKSILER